MAGWVKEEGFEEQGSSRNMRGAEGVDAGRAVASTGVAGGWEKCGSLRGPRSAGRQWMA